MPIPWVRTAANGCVLLSATLGDETLQGVMDLRTGTSLLFNAHRLLHWGPMTIDASTTSSAPDRAIRRWERLSGGWSTLTLRDETVVLGANGLPELAHDRGNPFAEPLRWRYQPATGVFEREPLVLTEAGEHAIAQWMSKDPAWSTTALWHFVRQLVPGLTKDAHAGGPTRHDRLRFSTAVRRSLQPARAALYRHLRGRVDAAARSHADAAPQLAGDLARAGFGDLATASAHRLSHETLTLARLWLSLMQAHANGVGDPDGRTLAAGALTVGQRTELVALVNHLVTRLSAHARQQPPSDWIRLDDSPAGSWSIVRRLRRAGVPIDIDAFDLDPASDATDRNSIVDHYDVQLPALQRFLVHLEQRLRADDPLGGLRPLRPVARVTEDDLPELLAASTPMPIDAWYACHAAEGSPVEAALRRAAREALRERLTDVLASMDRFGEQEAPLAAHAILNSRLYDALLRLMGPAPNLRTVGEAVVPGEVLMLEDGRGERHYAQALRARGCRPDFLGTARRPAEQASGCWRMLGTSAQLDEQLAPRHRPCALPQVLDPTAYRQWDFRDTIGQVGDVYLYDNPYTQRSELFRRRAGVEQRGRDEGPYESFPVDGGNSPSWQYLGDTDSLSPAQLGAWARHETALRPVAFPRVLLQWWLERLAPPTEPGQPVEFELAGRAWSQRLVDGTHYRLDGPLLTITLEGEDPCPFTPARDAGFQALRQRHADAAPRALRTVAVQSHGRPIDLDDLPRLGGSELLLRAEPQGHAREVDLDDLASQPATLVYEGDDLLIAPAGGGTRLRIEDALRPVVGELLPASLEPDPHLRLTRQGGTTAVPLPDVDDVLRVPALTVHGTQLVVQREGEDLKLSDGTDWAPVRVYGAFDLAQDSPAVAEDFLVASEASVLLRYEIGHASAGAHGGTDAGSSTAAGGITESRTGTWQDSVLPPRLVTALARSTLTSTAPQRWTLTFTSTPASLMEGSAVAEPAVQTLLMPPLDWTSSPPAAIWPLQAARLSEWMASSPGDAAPAWGPAPFMVPPPPSGGSRSSQAVLASPP